MLAEEALIAWRESSAEPLHFKRVGCGEPRVNTKLNHPLLLPQPLPNTLQSSGNARSLCIWRISRGCWSARDARNTEAEERQ